MNTNLSGARGVEITRTFVRAFFDLHLRNRPTRLLNATSPHYPEVHLCSPTPETCG